MIYFLLLLLMIPQFANAADYLPINLTWDRPTHWEAGGAIHSDYPLTYKIYAGIDSLPGNEDIPRYMVAAGITSTSFIYTVPDYIGIEGGKAWFFTYSCNENICSLDSSNHVGIDLITIPPPSTIPPVPPYQHKPIYLTP